MTTALRAPMILTEFLDWEERQELRCEFDGFRPVAMTGGTARHDIIGNRVSTLLTMQLRGKRCQPWEPTTKIEVRQCIRYPDPLVYCSPVPPCATDIPEPVVVFEVLGPGTSRTDCIERLREYPAPPSIQHYVLLEQDSIAAMVFVRSRDNRTSSVPVDGDILRVPEIDVALPLAKSIGTAVCRTRTEPTPPQPERTTRWTR